MMTDRDNNGRRAEDNTDGMCLACAVLFAIAGFVVAVGVGVVVGVGWMSR